MLIDQIARILLLPVAAAALFATPTGAPAAEKYPTKPIRFIVPFVPGGGTDITARAVGAKMSETFGQQVVIDNRPGAAGNIGMDIAAKSPPDGYTVVLVSATHSVNPSLNKNLPYDLVRDLAAISQVTAQPYALTVHPSLPARSVNELVGLLRAKPNFYTYGSSGTGGLSHLAGALLGSLGKAQWIHVPYKGGAAAMTDLMGGRITVLFATIIGTRVHVNSGKMRWLAVSTAKRSSAAPELPTVAEAGLPGFEISGWYGVLAAAKTPKSIIATLNRAIVDAVKSPDVGPKFAADGSDPVGSSPEEFAAHIKAAIAKNGQIIRDAGITAN
ncbi:MAG: hypothetical protein A3F74_14475 [Betaproteobacteria bacterium RIFCSPLOWO2_12_FULL_62_58]|nr:MAG: hypothetical protein A3F74_14475 [Betaproteobacteria bacterium RIFCSPLOWO2_12_FULL_62_58]